MLSLRSTGLMFACFISITAMAMDIDFNMPRLQDYKNRISHMVQDGTVNLANADKNQALALYKAEQARLTTIKNPDNVFDEATRVLTKTLIDGTRNNPDYQAVLQSSIKSERYGWYHFHQDKIDASKQIAVGIIMGLLKERGVVFPTEEQLGNNPKWHAAFLRVNETVSPKTSPRFIPGSFALLYFQEAAEREAIAEDLRVRAAFRAIWKK